MVYEEIGLTAINKEDYTVIWHKNDFSDIV